MRIKWGQDLATGLMFLFVGVAALWIGADYPMGTPQRPGTGVLPRMLSWALVGTGVILGIKSVVSGDVEITSWAWRPLLWVTLGTVVFGLFIDEFGLVVSMILSMTLCALGTADTRWREFAIFSAIMIVSSYLMFVWLLGMPVTVWPTKIPAFITALFR